MTTTLKHAPQASLAASMKAEREREKAQAVRDYAAEQLARQTNMARLRALRLAKERAETLVARVPEPASKKAATKLARAQRQLRTSV
jgi:hypothetical protein